MMLLRTVARYLLLGATMSGMAGCHSDPFGTNTDDSVVATASVTGTVTAPVDGPGRAVAVTFNTSDGRDASDLFVATNLSNLPDGWSAASGGRFSCPAVSTGNNCVLNLTYAPTNGTSGTVWLVFAYTNDAGNERIGTISIPYGGTTNPPLVVTGIYALTLSALTTYSIDNGSTWLRTLNQVGGAAGNAGVADADTFLAVDSGGVMYIATGKSGPDTLLYSSDGVLWTPMNTALPNSDMGVSVFASNTTVYVGTRGGYVYSTANHGTSWTLVASPSQLDGTPVTALCVGINSTIYVGTDGVFGSSGGTVYLSTSNGSSWSQLGTTQPDGGQVWGLAVDATGTVYAATSNSGAFGGALPYITNYNGPWNSIATLSSAGNGGLWSVSALGNTVYVGTGNGTILDATNATSGSATWTQTSSQPIGDGSAIISLFVNQGALSPLFVDTSGVVAVGGGQTSITITNLTNAVVKDVQAQLPPSLSGVTQTSSDCASVAPQATCTLKFSSSLPYGPQNLAIAGANSTGPIARAALVFSMNGYLVYNLDPTTHTAYVVDNNDLSSAAWGPGEPFSIGDDIQGITEADALPGSACSGATDGACDSRQIVAQYPGGGYAANLCYNSASGGFAPGTWYLPSAGELNGGVYLDATTDSFLRSSSVSTGIFTLYSLGVLPNITPGRYWSSTEYSGFPTDFAWLQSFSSGGGGSQSQGPKGFPSSVRCARAISY